MKHGAPDRAKRGRSLVSGLAPLGGVHGGRVHAWFGEDRTGVREITSASAHGSAMAQVLRLTFRQLSRGHKQR
jgi:hypothetical protein